MNSSIEPAVGVRHLPFESRGKVAAAIDLGTQTALLLIAERTTDGGLEVLEDHALSARLGAGLARSGALSDEAIERTLEILGHFQRRVAQHGVEAGALRAVGTAVLRRAPDAARFLELARTRLGLAIEVLSGDEEARLGYAAVRALGDLGDLGDPGADSELALVDLGGGSVEIVSAGGARRCSLPFGAVTATEGHAAEVAAGSGLAGLDAELAAALGDMQPLPPGAEVIAIGGTAGNLACLVGGDASFDPRLVEGRAISATDALQWSDRLQALDLEQRRDLGIEPDRAEILPAGLRILGRVLERLAPERARVSGRGLRHALVEELLA